jgi:hypothetical protein
MNESKWKPRTDLCFVSTAALERGLDGGEERFAAYYFALYHCSPDEAAGINERREELRQLFPEKVITVGKHYVLVGEPAYQALAAYYAALVECGTLSDQFRSYAKQRLEEMADTYRRSQSLPVPVDLTEGQLAQDHRLEFLTCVALRNSQVIPVSETQRVPR